MSFYGCMVISASQPVEIPTPEDCSMHSHIEGSYSGSVGIQSLFSYELTFGRSQTPYFVNASLEIPYPSKIIDEVSYSERKETNTVEERFRDYFYRNLLSGPGLVSIEQRHPYGYVFLHSKDVDMYLYGLYNDRCSLLYWSNIENLELLLGNKFWIYRFKPQKNFSTIIYTRRVCARWNRWKETLKENGQRFQALERSLMRNVWTPPNS